MINKIEPSLLLNFSGFSDKGTRTEDRSSGTPMSKSPSSEGTIASFPGPVVLFSSRPKLWFLAFFEVVTILMSSFAILIGLSHPEAQFAVCIGLLGLLYSVGLGIKLAVLYSPDAISLRLTSSGFEVVAGLQKRIFLWTQVSDFDVFAGRRSSSEVVFRYDGPHRSSLRVGLGWLDAAFAGGRNAYLPDTYGLRTADLVRVLTTWRELAVGSGIDNRASVRSDG